MDVASDRFLSITEKIELSLKGVSGTLKHQLGSITLREFPWLELVSVGNVRAQTGSGSAEYMEVGVEGPNNFHACLRVDGENRWGLSEEQATLLGSYALRRQGARDPSAGHLYTMPSDQGEGA